MAILNKHPGYVEGPKGKALFVHIPRTGGQSVCRAVHCSDGHISLSCSMSMLGDTFDGCKAVSIIRNPWDHAVSWYCYMQGSGNLESPKEHVDGFRKWVAEGCPGSTAMWSGITSNVLNQMAWLKSSITCDVFKFPEGIRQAIDSIAEATGVNVSSGLPRDGPSARLPNYATYYDDATVHAIAEIREREIMVFGWKFGE